MFMISRASIGKRGAINKYSITRWRRKGLQRQGERKLEQVIHKDQRMERDTEKKGREGSTHSKGGDYEGDEGRGTNR